MPARTLLVHLTDPHLRVGDPKPAAAFEAAIERVALLRPAPVAVLVTGDIADDGAPEDYAQAASLLGVLPMPVHVIPGNHDDRAAMRAAFGHAGASAEPIQFVVQAGPLRIIACDTTIPGAHPGQLDVAWIEAQLAAAPDQPTIVAMHHPPVLIGVTSLDVLGLPADDRAALGVLLQRSPQVVRVVAGHVHRAATGMLGGVAVTTAPSVGLQLDLDFVGDEMAVNDDPPGFLIHILTADGLVSHVQSL